MRKEGDVYSSKGKQCREKVDTNKVMSTSEGEREKKGEERGGEGKIARPR